MVALSSHHDELCADQVLVSFARLSKSQMTQGSILKKWFLFHA